jgi:phosphatidate cytidylyltransferase
VLKVRLLLAALILVPLISLVYLDFTWGAWAPGILLAPLAVLVAAMAAGEVHSLLHHQLRDRPVWPVVVGAIGIMLATAAPLGWDLVGREYPSNCPVGPAGWPVFALAIAVMVLFVLEMRRFEDGGQGEHLAALSAQVLVVVYAGLLPAFLILIRRFKDNEWGMLGLVSLLVITKLGDTMAYTFGKTMGKRKLSPRLSPGKTVEGAVGSMVGAVGSALACGMWLQPALTGTQADAWRMGWWAGLGLALGISGMIGDLAESLLKRDAGKKDSSSWMPGLGGILDVLDSVLFATPIAYLFWIAY